MSKESWLATFPPLRGLSGRWQGPLINLAYRFCHDRGRAEEMAQEAFLRAYRGLGQWRKDAVFSTWLFALATNLYRSELRRIPARMCRSTTLPNLRTRALLMEASKTRTGIWRCGARSVLCRRNIARP